MDPAELVRLLYDRFNAKDMEAVLALMHHDVVWANGLEGGYVHGRQGVRDYWRRQWEMMSPRAEPSRLSDRGDGTIEVEVQLTAHDREGSLLFERPVRHVFRIEDGLVRRFDIAPGP